MLFPLYASLPFCFPIASPLNVISSAHFLLLCISTVLFCCPQIYVFYCFPFHISFSHSLSWLFLCGHFHSNISLPESLLCPGVLHVEIRWKYLARALVLGCYYNWRTLISSAGDLTFLYTAPYLPTALIRNLQGGGDRKQSQRKN